jgi:alpha-ribazole phosphatase
LRHGQIINTDKQKSFIGISDIRLDDSGINQAIYWKKAFSAFKLNAIYASSLSRCQETAMIISNRIIDKEKSYITDTDLNEINLGDWDGQSFDQIKSKYPKQFKQRGETLDIFRPPNGEGFADLALRVVPCFENIVKNSGNKLIITHAGVIRVILCHILKKPLKNLFEIKMDYGQVFVLR